MKQKKGASNPKKKKSGGSLVMEAKDIALAGKKV